MKIQSLSVVVPNKQCINRCSSCPSRMHDNDYPILLDETKPDFDLHLKDYIKRLEFARDNGCNTLMLTGTSEPQQNRKFLTWFGMMMQMMETPFRSIEMQCTGVLLNDTYVQFLRRHVGVTLMALSIFSLNSRENEKIIGPPTNIILQDVIERIKSSGMSLRMCLNLTKHFDHFADSPDHLFELMKDCGADQVTLRVLYAGDDDRPENVWVRENAAKPETVQALKDYIRGSGVGHNYVEGHGKLIGRLPYGAYKYSLNGMSVVIDDDSMGKDADDIDSYKYLILRPDCKLYSSWDDKGSLVF